MIRIAYVINSIRKNGPTNVLINMVFAIDHDRYDPTIITLINENDESLLIMLREKGINIIELNMSKSFFTMFKSHRLKDVINNGKYDLVHTHSHIPAIMAQNIKCKKVSTVHNRLNEDFINSYGFIKGKILNYFYLHALNKHDKTICCSKSSWQVVWKYVKNSMYVRNGVDIEINSEDCFLREKLSIPKDATVYIFAGNLIKLKNVLTMVKYMKDQMKDNEYFLILGDGPLLETIKMYESDNIKVLGFKKNVVDYLRISNVYVSFSTSEGLSISVIEALANNLLLLLSDIPSHKEFFEIDDNQYIGEYFSLGTFAHHLSILRGKLPGSTKGFQHKYLSGESMMSGYMNEYRKVINHL